MGKKSKKGVSRAGKTARPAAGKGKKCRLKGVSSAEPSLASVTSKEEVAHQHLPGDFSAPVSTSRNKSLPKNVVVVSPSPASDNNKENSARDADSAGNAAPSTQAPPVVQPPPVQSTPFKTDDGDEDKKAPELVAETPSHDVWSSKLRDAITNETTNSPAVLDVTMDESQVADLVEAKDREAPKEDIPEVKEAIPVKKETRKETDTPTAKSTPPAEAPKETILPKTVAEPEAPPKEVIPDQAPKNSESTKQTVSEAAAAPKKDATQGLVDLTKPAPKEAGIKQKDCGCTIL